jgi:hypothetical protein
MALFQETLADHGIIHLRDLGYRVWHDTSEVEEADLSFRSSTYAGDRTSEANIVLSPGEAWVSTEHAYRVCTSDGQHVRLRVVARATGAEPVVAYAPPAPYLLLGEQPVHRPPRAKQAPGLPAGNGHD